MSVLYKIDKDTLIDEFGVDHSKFSLREELEYNMMRAEEKNIKLNNNYTSTLPSENFVIKDDKNYAWSAPQEYDRRPNAAGVFNNFVKINKENPIQKPITTGNVVGDYLLSKALNKIPLAKVAAVSANTGYLLGGYAGNLKRASDEAHLFNKNK